MGKASRRNASAREGLWCALSTRLHTPLVNGSVSYFDHPILLLHTDQVDQELLIRCGGYCKDFRGTLLPGRIKIMGCYLMLHPLCGRSIEPQVGAIWCGRRWKIKRVLPPVNLFFAGRK
jgi:hypothetical protein